MSLFEVKLEVPAAAVDAIDTVLLEYGSASWSVLENVITRKAWIVGVGTEEPSLRREWEELAPRLRAANIAIAGAETWRALGDADWRDSYKAHFHAWQFGRLHWVPVWQRDSFRLPPGHAVLWLDPGLAFGTGNHETTRLCIERLVEIDAALAARAWSHETARVIDAGCGSGILALSAALLGFRHVDGFDNDPEAVRVSEENATLNGLSGNVHFFTGDLVSGLVGRQAEIVMANILADVLIRFARELTKVVTPGGVLILSGILAQEKAAVQEAFAAIEPPWPVDSRQMGEWCDVVLQRPWR